jgi:hypothetical protein
MNIEELKKTIKGNAFQESHGSTTLVVDIETVLDLLDELKQCDIPDVIGSVSAHIHYDHSLKAMQLMVDKEELTVEEFRELPEVKKLWLAMDVIKEHYL